MKKTLPARFGVKFFMPITAKTFMCGKLLHSLLCSFVAAH